MSLQSATRALAATLFLCFFIAACHGGANQAITGKYWLSERPLGVDAPDAVEFRADGSCLIEVGESAAIAGKYRADSAGRLSIEAGERTKYSYKYQLLKYTLVLAIDADTALYYVRLPEGPRPQFGEIQGIFHMHNDLGDSAGEITSDHRFNIHLLDLISEDHTYDDIHMDGKCSYAGGVVTYVPEHSNAPQQDKYLRDFILKRDAQGLWIIEPFHDDISCETSATDLELPPAPSGYRKGK